MAKFQQSWPGLNPSTVASIQKNPGKSCSNWISIYPGRPDVKKESGSVFELPCQKSSDADSFLFSVFRFEKQTSVGLQMYEFLGPVYTLWLLCAPAVERILAQRSVTELHPAL